MSYQVDTAIVTAQFEVAVCQVQPAVDDLGHGHLSLSDVQTSWLSISAMAGVAFDTEGGNAAIFIRLTVHRSSSIDCDITEPDGRV